MDYSIPHEWYKKMLHLDEHVTPSAGGPPMYWPKDETLPADEQDPQDASTTASRVKPK